MTPLEQHKARKRIEAAAELDPNTYVPILDALDRDDTDREPEPLEKGDDGIHGGLDIFEFCQCCGSHTNTEFWTT